MTVMDRYFSKLGDYQESAGSEVTGMLEELYLDGNRQVSIHTLCMVFYISDIFLDQKTLSNNLKIIVHMLKESKDCSLSKHARTIFMHLSAPFLKK